MDYKLPLLVAMKRALDEKLSTLFVRQGHYAAESDDSPSDPQGDLSIKHIGDLMDHDLSHFLAVARTRSAAVNKEHE